MSLASDMIYIQQSTCKFFKVCFDRENQLNSKNRTSILLASALVLTANQAQAKAPVAKPVAQPKPAKVAKPVKPQALDIRDKWAVLIGIPAYNDGNIKPIKNASRNVINMVNTLCDPEAGRFAKDHVLILTGGKATKANIIKATYDEWLIHKALPNHLVLLYISGRVTPTDGLDDLLLLPVDADLANKENTAVSLKSMLAEAKRRTQCKNILVLLDTQSQTTDGKPLADTVKQVASFTGTTILAADKNGLNSADSNEAPGSLFVQYLSEGIKAGGGNLPVETVADFIDDSLSKNPQAGGQKSLLIAAADNQELVKQPFGIKIKLAYDPKNIKIGHPLDTLAIKRPDLDQNLSASMREPIKDRQKTASLDDDKDKNDRDDDDEDVDYSKINFDDYMALMKKSIQAKWTPPKDMNQKTIVAVFSIQRNGAITDAEIVESSGKSDVDETALKALKEASPLQALPKGSPKYLQVRYKFDWKVSSQ